MATTITAGNATNGAAISSDNTGILELKTGTGSGTTAMTVNASQNVGIGTSSPNQRLQINNPAASSSLALFTNANTGSAGGDGSYCGIDATGNMYVWNQENLPMLFGTNNGERMRIDSSGNVGIGTSSLTANNRMTLNASSGNNGFEIQNSGDSNRGGRLVATGSAASGTFAINTTSSGYALTFGIDSAERARIDTSGNLLVGAAANPVLSWTSANRIYADQSTADYVLHARNSSTTAGNNYGITISYAATPNNTGNAFIDARDATAPRFQVRSNGGIANFSANNVNLSDQRLKKDIQLSGSYLDKICAIPVKTFLYKDQTDSDLNLGVIAQDVEAVAPELVDAGGFGEIPEDGVPYKTIYQTDLQYALMKCIQELKAELDATKAEVAALKGEA